MLGSVSPWIEAIVLSRGAASGVTTVDYCPIDVKSDKIAFHLVGDPELKNKQFDVVATFSSIGRRPRSLRRSDKPDQGHQRHRGGVRHPASGRGPPVQRPRGRRMHRGNFHRIYNKKRLNRLFAIFETTVEEIESAGDAVPWPPGRTVNGSPAVNWTGADWHNEPIFILRKAIPEPPPQLPKRLLVIGMEVPISTSAEPAFVWCRSCWGFVGVALDFVSFKAQKYWRPRRACDTTSFCPDIGIEVKWSSDGRAPADERVRRHRDPAVLLAADVSDGVLPHELHAVRKGRSFVVLSDDLHTMRRFDSRSR